MRSVYVRICHDDNAVVAQLVGVVLILAKLIEVENTGHLIPLEQPKEISVIIKEYLAS